MFGITYDTWSAVCKMYFEMKTSIKKAYLQWFPFSKLSKEEQGYISGQVFFHDYIESGAYVLYSAAMHRTENFIQKGDGSFRDSSLISPILYLIIQSIGKEISNRYISKRPNNIEVYYAGNYEYMRPLYKQDYDAFFKSINSNIEQYQYFIKTDITNFFSSINLDKLLYQIDKVCNTHSARISQNHLLLYKELLAYSGDGRFPLIENSIASSYLASVIYLDMVDTRIYKYIKNIVTIFNDFRIIRYVDDMYILITSDKPLGCLHEAYNEIRNEYSSILKEYGLALNTKKCCFKSTNEINEELKKSLYDEYFNGKKCEIEELFSGHLYKFISDLSTELLVDYISVEEYNELINKHFSMTDVVFTSSEVFNYFIYENTSELKSKKMINAIVNLVNQDVSFISLDPKRLTVMIMKTKSEKAIKVFLNQLFIRYRTNKWNSYDTTIAITYLIQSKFQHIDLIKILEKKHPELYLYYKSFCKKSFCDIWQYKRAEKHRIIINDDKKSYFLFFMYLIEKQKKNSMAMFAYFKNFFDRMTANMAFLSHYEPNMKKPNYKGFYQEKLIKKFYSQIDDGDLIIEHAHELRNANPLAHASAELIDKESTSKEIDKCIYNLNILLDDYCKII